jgi:hypothetical protein
MTRGVAAIALTAAAALAAAAPAAAPAAAGPRVETMIAGKTRTLLPARTVRASATTVRAGGRRCAVGAATPLAVLVAARRAGGPSLRVKDYGSCGPRPADAGGLFVFQVGRDRNRGRDGWVYKVGRRVGTTPAADPSGPFGTGRRLAGGARVLWFWCRMGARGCQRTLGISAPRSATAGSPVTVTVTGYDDMGRGTPVAGATVRIGPVAQTTAADGRATLAAPGAGRARVTASARGLVDAFPETLQVR